MSHVGLADSINMLMCTAYSHEIVQLDTCVLSPWTRLISSEGLQLPMHLKKWNLAWQACASRNKQKSVMHMFVSSHMCTQPLGTSHISFESL